MKTRNKYIVEWERETNNLADYFKERHFGIDADSYWVADCCGDVFYINDYFFSLNDIVEFIRHDYSTEKVCEYMDYALEFATNENERKDGRRENPINIKNWKHLKE